MLCGVGAGSSRKERDHHILQVRSAGLSFVLQDAISGRPDRLPELDSIDRDDG
jgi:hypothetical protein